MSDTHIISAEKSSNERPLDSKKIMRKIVYERNFHSAQLYSSVKIYLSVEVPGNPEKKTAEVQAIQSILATMAGGSTSTPSTSTPTECIDLI